jgi:hypothetical protein
MTLSRYHVFLLMFLLSITLFPVETMATPDSNYAPVAHRVQVSSVTRTWNTLSLLYEEQFHDPIMLDEEIENIHSLVPQLVDIEVIGESFEERNITCLRITNEMNPVQKAKTLVVAQHHGREQITVEMALRFILWLLNGYGTNATITEYVDTQEIYIIPTLNPDALDIVVNDGNHWLRKNLRPYDNDGDGLFGEDDAEDVDGDGKISEFYVYIKDYPTQVPSLYDFDYSYREGIDNDNDSLLNEDEVGLVDLNRNYPYFWDTGGPDSVDVTSQVYHGTEPFSEPETQAFRDFALQHKFAMAYSLHSGTNATYFTLDGDNHYLEPLLYYEMAGDLHDILPDGFYSGTQLYPSSNDRIESAVSGGWGEWMYYACGNTVPITFEVYTNATANENQGMGEVIENNNTHIIREWKDIYGYFNPEKEYIDTLWIEIKPAFVYLLEMTPCIEVAITGATGGVHIGDAVTLATSMHCLSPRLGSKEVMKVLDNGSLVLDILIAVGADQTLIDYATITLPEDLTASGYTISIGNNYTGYTQFILTLEVTGGLDIVLIGVGVGVVLIAVAIFVYMKKR